MIERLIFSFTTVVLHQQMRDEMTTTTLPPATHIPNMLSQTNGRAWFHIYIHLVGIHTFPSPMDLIANLQSALRKHLFRNA